MTAVMYVHDRAVAVRSRSVTLDRPARQAPAGCKVCEHREVRKCDLCSQLGLGGDNHSREWCYVDPKSKVYKPEVRQRRVA